MLSVYIKRFHSNFEIDPATFRKNTVEIHRIAVIKKQQKKRFPRKNLVFWKYKKT